jgi:hypothetical protein
MLPFGDVCYVCISVFGLFKISYVISPKMNHMKIKTRLPEVVIEEEHSEVE